MWGKLHGEFLMPCKHALDAATPLFFRFENFRLRVFQVEVTASTIAVWRRLNSTATRLRSMYRRLQLGSAFIPAVPLVIGVLFCPESPR
jgi:hypothetical protein